MKRSVVSKTKYFAKVVVYFKERNKRALSRMIGTIQMKEFKCKKDCKQMNWLTLNHRY